MTQKTSGKQALIVEAAGQEIGLVVDEDTEVIWLEENVIEAADRIAQYNEFIKSIGKVDQRLLIILDLSKHFSKKNDPDERRRM